MKPSRKTVLACIFTLGFFLIMGTLIFHEQPQANRDILNVLLGGLITLMVRIVTNEFPSRGEPPEKPEAVVK